MFFLSSTYSVQCKCTGVSLCESTPITVDRGKPPQAACAQATGLICSYERFDFFLFLLPGTERRAAGKRPMGQRDIRPLGVLNSDASFTRKVLFDDSGVQCCICPSNGSSCVYRPAEIPPSNHVFGKIKVKIFNALFKTMCWVQTVV